MPSRRRFLILGICSMSVFIVALDSTAVNIALPSIRADLHTTVAQLQWTVDAYLLTLAALLVLSGAMADRFGRARVFKLGLVLFTLGSLLCSVAPSVELLIAFRVLQAIGGSMLNPVALSIIRDAFDDPRERAFAYGVWGALAGASLAVGPVVGGLLVTAVDWRAIFWINLPIGLLVLALTARFVPESKAPHPRRVDVGGQALVIVLLLSLTYGIIEAPGWGWASQQTLALFAVAALALAALIAWELRRFEPLIDVRLFRSVPFSGATTIAVLSFVALGAFLFLNTIYLQDARRLSPLEAGLWTLPMASMAFACAPLAGRLVGRAGTRAPLVLGGLGMGLGALLLADLSATTSFQQLLPGYVLFGAGAGFINPPITNTAIAGMPPSQAAVAAAIASTSRQVGQTLGVAIVGAIAVPAAAAALPGQIASDSHVGWLVIAGCGALVLVLGFATTSRRALATAARVGAVAHEGR